MIRLTISLLLGVTLVGCGDEESPFQPSPISAPTAVPSGVAPQSSELLGAIGPLDLAGLDVGVIGEGMVDVGGFDQSMLDMGVVAPGDMVDGTPVAGTVEPNAGARVLDTGLVDAGMPGLDMSDAVELDPGMLAEAERGTDAASVNASGDIDFSSVTWSWNSGNSHLMPSDIPDGRVVADVGGGTAGQTNIWRRSNGTGLIRILSRSNLGGSTFRTAGLTKTLSRRRDIRGVGLYVAGVSAAEVKTIEAATGRGGRSDPTPEPIVTTNRPAAGCVLNPDEESVNTSWETSTLTVASTWSCYIDNPFLVARVRDYYSDNSGWLSIQGSASVDSVTHNATKNVSVSVTKNLTGASRTGQLWFRNTASSQPADDRLTIVQAPHPTDTPPSVTLALSGAAPPNNAAGVAVSGQTLTVRATATDNDLASVTYAWTVDPTATVTGTGRTATWAIPPSARGEYTFTVTVTDKLGATGSANASVEVIAPPVCRIEAAFRSNTDRSIHPNSVGTAKTPITFGYHRDETARGFLTWRRDADAPSADYCGSFPSFSRSNFRTSSWTPVGTTPASRSRLSAAGSVQDAFQALWEQELEFSVSTSSEVTQVAEIWMDVSSSGYVWPANERVLIGRRGAPAAPTCGQTTPAADSGKTQTYTVGGRYRMQGMTRNWTHLANGRDGGGCSATGFPLLAAGEQHICGYNGDARACEGSAPFLPDGAHRTDPRLVTTEVTDGGVTSTLTAEWVAVRVQAPREAGCTNPTLKVRNDGNDWIHLHFSCTHMPDGRSWYPGDKDFAQWGLTNVGLTWTAIAPPPGESDPSSITTPNPAESTTWPGSFSVACPATTARPINGFKVTGSVTYNGSAKTDTTGVSGICAQ